MVRKPLGLSVKVSALFFIALLSVLPLAFKAISLAAGITLPSADRLILNVVFIFACLAGLITSGADRHLNLAVINDILSDRLKGLVNPFKSAFSSAVLTAIFMASFSELFMAFPPEDTLWGIPLTLLFAVQPISFLGMLVISMIKRPHGKGTLVASLVGVILGLLVSTGPLSGVLFFLLKIENASALQAVFEGWAAVANVFLWPFVALSVIAALLGTPIFIVLSGIAYVAFSQGGGYVEMISLEHYGILTDKSIAAIPLFTLAGFLLAEGSAGRRLLEVVRASVGWIKGGPVIAAVIVATIFTTFTGASGVTILALGTLLTVILTGSGYKKDDAESIVTASGSLGMLFPPSLAIIIFGTTNIFSVDIFDLFKGAIIPGALMAFAMVAFGIFKGRGITRSTFSARELAFSAKDGFAEILLPVGIGAGYFSGFLSLIETAAFAALYSFVLEVFIRKDYTLRAAARTILSSVPVAGGVLVIIGAAKGLAFFLIDAGVPFMLTEFVMTFVESKYLFLFLLNLLLLVVGCLMDLYSAILVVSPLIMPVAESFGIHPVHTGVIFLTNLALGFLTPPVGMNLFIASYTFNKPIVRIVRNILPYLAIQFFILMLVTYVPAFSLALI
jgi:tripartite ATP-independent transporter DctM subunit